MVAKSLSLRFPAGPACLLGLALLTSTASQTSARRLVRLPAQLSSNSTDSQQSPLSAAANTEKANLATQTRQITLEEHADIFLARKDYRNAADYYQRALDARGSRDATLWNKLGIAYQMDMNYSAARKAYKYAGRYNRDFAEPWNNLGTTYFLENKFGKSIKYYKRAIKLRSDVASFHMNLSASYSRKKKFREAVEECREALRLDPNVLIEHSPTATTVQARGGDVEFYYYLAKVFASMSRPEDAVHYLRRALEDGFKDMKRLDQDPDFQKISRYPAYVQLRHNPPVAIED